MRTKPDPAYEPPNVVTLLTAKRWRLTKRITKAGEKQPAETPTLFTHAAEPVADLEDLFGLLRWLISMLASRHGRVLLVCQQKVLAALKSAGLPDNVTTGHFNALEGLDNYAQFDAIIILGRPLAKLSGVIPLAEAAAGRCLAASFGKQADPNTLFVPRRKNVHTAKDCGSSVRSRRPIRPGGPDHDDAPGEGA